MISPRKLLPQREIVPCALCGCKESEPVLHQDQHGLGLTTSVCTGCGLLFLNPRPTEASYRSFYEGLYHKLYPSRLAFAGSGFSQQISESRVRFYLPFLGSEINLLEIGSGDGQFLRATQQMTGATKVRGIDLAPEEVQACQAQSLNVHIGCIENEPTSGYTHIAAFHTLEHELQPVAMMRAIAERLAPGGLLFLEVPDIEGDWSGLGMIHVAHPYMYSRATLQRLLEISGFEIVSIEQLSAAPFSLSLRAVARVTSTPATQRYFAPDINAIRSAIRRKAGNLRSQAVARVARNLLRMLLPQKLIASLWTWKNYGTLTPGISHPAEGRQP